MLSMRRLAIILVMIFSCTAALYAGQVDSLITNGDFSVLNDQGFPESWHASRFSGTAAIAVDVTVYRSAGRSVRLDGDGNSRIAASTARLNITGNATYRFSVWYRTPGSAQGAVSRADHVIARLQAWSVDEKGQLIKVLWDDRRTRTSSTTAFEVAGGENLHLKPSSDPGEGEWRCLEAEFQLPEHAAVLQVNLFNWFGPDTVWYDDVSLVRLETEIDWEEGFTVKGFVSPDSLLARLKPEHPRLLASLDDFERIKNNLFSERLIINWYSELQSLANSILRQNTSTYELPDGVRLLSVSRRVLERVETLAMMYRLTGKREYVDRTWDELVAAADFPDWNPNHFLDTAEMTRAFALAYDWLYDVWTDEERDFIRAAMVEKGLRPALAGFRGTAPWRNQWARRTNNWNFVCNSGITMGALAIAEDEPELAKELIREALFSVNFAIDRFAPDGAWDEGLGYWNYSIRYLIPFIASLQSALGTDFGLTATPGLAETGYFPIYLVGPNGSFNFADSGSGTVRTPELFWLDNTYDVPAFSWWQRQHTSPGSAAARCLLWYRPSAGAEFEPTPDRLPLDRYFRETEVVTFRSAWEDGKAAFAGMKAGINAAHHNDMDVGTFVFDALGVRWIEALGADDYNLPGYFDYNRGRWNYYRKRPEGRNTIVLNPGEGPGQDLLTDSPARFVFHRFTDAEAVAIADLTPAYASQAAKVHRGIALFDRRRQLLIQDEITTLKPSEFWSFMHTSAAIEISEDGRVATLTSGNRRMKATILSPPEATWISMPAEPLPGSPNPPGQAVNAGVRKLAVHLQDVTDLRLVVQLTPLEKGVYAPFSPEVIPLDEWSETDKDLWGSLLRVTVEWPTMSRDGKVFGQVPVIFVCDEREHADLQAFTVLFNDEVIYQGQAVPEQLILDTDEIDDGVYDLEIRFHLQDGSTVRETIEVTVENFWYLSDEQLPPLFPEGSGWFGTGDRSETKEASFGWTYAPEDEALFGDTSRRMREENTSEYLIWEAPWLRSFSIRLYAPTDRLEGVLQLSHSADGSAW